MHFKSYKNRIQKGAIGFFMVLMLLAPVSVTLPTPPSTAEEGETAIAHFTIANAQEKDTKGEKVKESSSWWNFGDWVARRTFSWLGNVLLNIAAFFTWMGGQALNYAMEKLVFGMGTLINGQSFGGAIDTGWKIIRDICNLFFIFGFIYTGIRTIIDPEAAETKRFLSKIIIGALLINFSLFIVKIVIDFSNFTAIQIYNAMTQGSTSLSAKIADTLGIVTIFSMPGANTLKELTDAGSLWFYIGAATLLLTAAFVFAAGAALLIIRFVVLVLIMVFSPILFAATIFPQTEHYASDLWRKLFSHSFFAPAYMLFTLIAITLLSAIPIGGAKNLMKGLTNNIENQAGVTTTFDSYSVILFFFLAIAFLVAALISAQKLGIQGGDMAVSLGKKLRSHGQQFVGASTAGLAAASLRATAGRVANDISESDWLKNQAGRSDRKGLSRVGGLLARGTLKGSQKAADVNFDARSIGGAGKTLGIGDGRKGGWKTVQKEIKEKDEAFAKSLGQLDDTDARVLTRKKEMEQREKEKRDLEEDLKSIKGDTPESKQARKDMRDHIEHKKHEIHDAKVAYETEKQRRILGSTFISEGVENELNEYVSDVKEAKKELDAVWKIKADPKATDDEKKKALASVPDLLKKIKGAEKDRDKFMLQNIDRGLAGVYEKSSIITAWPLGRLARHEKESGKALRKARKDGLPKEKGGHDDHGGGHGGDEHAEEHHEGGDAHETHHKEHKIEIAHGSNNSRGVTKYPSGGDSHGEEHKHP